MLIARAPELPDDRETCPADEPRELDPILMARDPEPPEDLPDGAEAERPPPDLVALRARRYILVPAIIVITSNTLEKRIIKAFFIT